MAIPGGGIRSIDGKLRVWIGGLPQTGSKDAALDAALRVHMSSSGLNCVHAQIGKNGCGGAAFTSQMEAEQAIMTLNGSFFQGQIIQVDRVTKKDGSNGTNLAWTPKPRGKGSGGKGWGGKGGKGGGSNWGGHQVMNPMDMMKAMMATMSGKGSSKGKSTGLHSYDGKLRVWIGGLPQYGVYDEALNKRLKDHMSTTGLQCLYANVGKNGRGGAAFKSPYEAEQAIATMNGTIFEGSVIQVDHLTKGNKF